MTRPQLGVCLLLVLLGSFLCLASLAMIPHRVTLPNSYTIERDRVGLRQHNWRLVAPVDGIRRTLASGKYADGQVVSLDPVEIHYYGTVRSECPPYFHLDFPALSNGVECGPGNLKGYQGKSISGPEFAKIHARFDRHGMFPNCPWVIEVKIPVLESTLHDVMQVVARSADPNFALDLPKALRWEESFSNPGKDDSQSSAPNGG